MSRICHTVLGGIATIGAIAIAPSAAAQAAAPATLRVIEPRPFGHSLGDLLERRLIVDTAAATTIAADSLPKKGRIGAGLELRDVVLERHVQGTSARHDLLLRYQIFTAPTQVRTLSLPAVTLTLSGTATPQRVTAGPAEIFVAPLVAEAFATSAQLPALRPDTAPPLIDTGANRQRLVIVGLAMLLIGCTLAYRRFLAWLPGRPRAPFAEAFRDLRRLAGTPSPESARSALRRLHRAFDETAGTAVFAEHLERFFAAHPAYLDRRAQIVDFFARSRAEFFAPGDGPVGDITWLVALCRDCRRIERERR